MFSYLRELFRSPRYSCVRAGDAVYNKEIIVSPKNSRCKCLCLPQAGRQHPQVLGDSPARTPHPRHVAGAACGCLEHWAMHGFWVLNLKWEGPIPGGFRDESCCYQLGTIQHCSLQWREVASDRVEGFLPGRPQKGKQGRSRVCSPVPCTSFLLALVHNKGLVAAMLTPSLLARGTAKCVWRS